MIWRYALRVGWHRKKSQILERVGSFKCWRNGCEIDLHVRTNFLMRVWSHPPVDWNESVSLPFKERFISDTFWHVAFHQEQRESCWASFEGRNVSLFTMQNRSIWCRIERLGLRSFFDRLRWFKSMDNSDFENYVNTLVVVTILPTPTKSIQTQR